MIYSAWVIAFGGAILSFYFGEIRGIEPCQLCWYQRMLLFSLAVILGVAAYRGDRGIRVYALPLALLGALIAIYQNLEPHLSMRGKVCNDGGCADPVFLLFGFLSLPVLSSVGFIAIVALLCLAKK